ncbi:SMI1/KNR4 family protein [Ottowia thiooxydans]|uniref:Knr4/Smi1-like domain-containing protein n=1 Tax=Ottowia thiooxydans TaxID=219182 RepID=A0ABV2QCC2_9BURK
MTEHSREVASDELIYHAETELGITFPEELKSIWRTHNCNELSGGWIFYPIFNPANPRKTAGAITYENLRGAWGKHIRDLGLLALASNGTGNHLVARVVDGYVEPKILHWHHETGRLTHWKPGIPAVMRSAQKSADSLAKIRDKFVLNKA